MSKADRIAQLEKDLERREDDYWRYFEEVQRIQKDLEVKKCWMSNASRDITEMEDLLEDLKEGDETQD